MSQPELAEAAHISLSTLRKIEQGSRAVTEPVLFAVADALGVEPERLTGVEGRSNSRVHGAIPEIRRAVDAYDLPEEGAVRPLNELRTAVHEATAQRLASQYTRLSGTIADLLSELSRALHTGSPDHRRQATALFTTAYRAADSIAYKYGYYDLSARMIEIMRQSAELAEDRVLTATVAYVRTETFFASRNLAPGLRALQDSLKVIPTPRTTREVAALGALHMRAAVVAARLLADSEVPDEHMRQARKFASLVPEGVYSGTAFGPDSMRVHEVSMAVELGDGGRAVTAAGGWSPPTGFPAERRSHYFLEVARAQLWTGRRDDAFRSLQNARRIAPQHVREHPQVREALGTLLRLHRTPPQSLISYAEWVGAI
ncbi:helix-turn-helix domain-containing protein [Actinocorallia sp. API 0066]|nr:helix-turn-helix domain-containing protein [Actinocorallia sp. API 0066]